MTKKERIDKLIQERLGKAKNKMDNILKNKTINVKEDDENEDSLSDLNEIEQAGEEEDDNDEGNEEEENEVDDENNKEDDKDNDDNNEEYEDNE